MGSNPSSGSGQLQGQLWTSVSLSVKWGVKGKVKSSTMLEVMTGLCEGGITNTPEPNFQVSVTKAGKAQGESA